MNEEQGPTEHTEMIGDGSAPLPTENSSTIAVQAEHKEYQPDPVQAQNTTKLSDVADDDADAEGDSEAETLIQSPEKRRSIVDNASSSLPSHGGSTIVTGSNAPSDEVQSRKRKRSNTEGQRDPNSPVLSRRSSPLSSPVAHAHSSASDSDRNTKRRAKKSDLKVIKHNGTAEDSPDSETSVSTKRQPSAPARQHRRDRQSMDTGERRETRSATYPRPSDDERSPSPHLTNRREHRRGVSTQLTGHEFERKKRGRPPLINTRRHRSVERTRSPDSDDDSPAPPRSGLHKFSSIEHDTMSPAKTGPRKWRDKNGRTWVARAANNDDLDGVKARLAERPDDLNLADNAGNSPLQIAALEGFVDIVEYLLQQGCEVDSRNIDKETPLIDAVENGHIEVVKLLLMYGANPRLGNAKGDEPYELVHSDDDNYGEIRRMLAEAKERDSGPPRPPDQQDTKDRDGGSSSRAASAASPRDSPPIGPRSPPPIASRRRTGRSESTRNDLLWQANTPENLTKLAGRGDTQGVASILNILQKAGTESLIAAAKAGHEEVLQYLLGMGDPDPDPEPVRSLNPGYNTPLLAAIGRGHVDVVKLLVNQSGFNPTKKYAGKTYYDIAEERKGQNWKQEHTILKAAYDRYVVAKGRKQGSPRKTRDLDRPKARLPRRSLSPVTQKQQSSSPTLTHKSLPIKNTELSPKERRKLDSGEKRKAGSDRPEVIDSASIAVSSDQDQTVKAVKKTHRVRRSQSDLPTPKMLDGDAPYRRRRLVTGKEHRRNKSTAPGSSGSSGEETADMIEVKQEEKQVPNLKRSRSSQTPDPKQNADGEKGRVGVKKRRTVESSPEEARNFPPKVLSPARLPSPAPSRKMSSSNGTQGLENKALTATPPDVIVEQQPAPSNDTNQIAEVEEIVQPSVEVVNSDLNTSSLNTSDPEILPDAEQVIKTNDVAATSVSTNQPPSVVPEQSNSLIRDEIADKGASSGHSDVDTEESAISKAARAREADQAAKEEAEKAAAVAAEEARRADEEKRAAELKEAEAAEQLKKKAEAEAEAKRQAELEAIARRKEQEEVEAMRLMLEIRQREEDAEKERRRIEALPAMLAACARMLNDNDPTVRSLQWLEQKFLPLYTVKTSQLDSSLSHEKVDEEWVPSFQVAGLLGTKDLTLRSFTTLHKRAATKHEQHCMWRVARIHLSYEYFTNPFNTSFEEGRRREHSESAKFLAMDGISWVKLTDFLAQITEQPHLTGIHLPTRSISLKSYADLYSSEQLKQATPLMPLTNGVHINGTLSDHE